MSTPHRQQRVVARRHRTFCLGFWAVITPLRSPLADLFAITLALSLYLLLALGDLAWD